jgi:hypothetical protein
MLRVSCAHASFCQLLPLSSLRQECLPPRQSRSLLTDFWTGADLGRHRDVFTIDQMPQHSARLLICRPVN